MYLYSMSSLVDFQFSVLESLATSLEGQTPTVNIKDTESLIERRHSRFGKVFINPLHPLLGNFVNMADDNNLGVGIFLILNENLHFSLCHRVV